MSSLRIRHLLTLICLGVGVHIIGEASAHDTAAFTTTTPEQIVWQNVPNGLGAQFAIIKGDPSGPGIYVIRVKFPPYVMDTPHFHPNNRYVTVLQGTWYAGTGETFDLSKATKLKPGSFMFHPGGGVHWDGSAGNEEVIVEVIGEGPGNTDQSNKDEPMWIRVD